MLPWKYALPHSFCSALNCIHYLSTFIEMQWASGKASLFKIEYLSNSSQKFIMIHLYKSNFIWIILCNRIAVRVLQWTGKSSNITIALCLASYTLMYAVILNLRMLQFILEIQGDFKSMKIKFKSMKIKYSLIPWILVSFICWNVLSQPKLFKEWYKCLRNYLSTNKMFSLALSSPIFILIFNIICDCKRSSSFYFSRKLLILGYIWFCSKDDLLSPLN